MPPCSVHIRGQNTWTGLTYVAKINGWVSRGWRFIYYIYCVSINIRYRQSRRRQDQLAEDKESPCRSNPWTASYPNRTVSRTIVTPPINLNIIPSQVNHYTPPKVNNTLQNFHTHPIPVNLWHPSRNCHFVKSSAVRQPRSDVIEMVEQNSDLHTSPVTTRHIFSSVTQPLDRADYYRLSDVVSVVDAISLRKDPNELRDTDCGIPLHHSYTYSSKLKTFKVPEIEMSNFQISKQ